VAIQTVKVDDGWYRISQFASGNPVGVRVLVPACSWLHEPRRLLGKKKNIISIPRMK